MKLSSGFRGISSVHFDGSVSIIIYDMPLRGLLTLRPVLSIRGASGSAFRGRLGGAVFTASPRSSFANRSCWATSHKLVQQILRDRQMRPPSGSS